MVKIRRQPFRFTVSPVFTGNRVADRTLFLQRRHRAERMVEVAAIASFVICALWLWIGLRARLWPLVGVEVGGIVASAVLVWLARTRSLDLARHAMMAVLLVLILAIALLEGNRPDAPPVLHLYLACLAMAAYLVFFDSSPAVPATYALACFAMYLAREFEWLDSPPLTGVDASITVATRHITYLFVFGICVVLADLFVRDLAGAEDRLAEVNERLEAILETMLPDSVARRLRQEGHTFADSVDGCSIVFADLVDFTRMTEDRPPDEAVVLLDRAFSRFDELVDRWGVEKIKTIGTTYMAVSGVPAPRADHAQAAARLALDMRETSAELGLKVRIGINSGPVVAGVIGRKRFIYDLWGDAVNVASRMESQGIPDAIQVTDTTRALLADGFRMEPRGRIRLRGRGEANAWMLLGARDSAASRTA